MEGPRRIEWLHSIPAIIGVGLGIVYGTGAITIYGQLKGAGLNAVATMSLVPLEQILGQGIGRMVREFGQTVLYFGILALAFASVEGAFGSSTPSTASAEDRPWFWSRLERLVSAPRVVGSLVFGSLALIFLTIPMKEALVYLIAMFPTVITARFMMQFTYSRGESSLRQTLMGASATFLIFVITTTIATAFIRPAPLPQVMLKGADGDLIRGGLVTQDNGSWYVAQPKENILAVNSRKVKAVSISYPKREVEQSVLDWVLGRPPSKPLGGPRDQ